MDLSEAVVEAARRPWTPGHHLGRAQGLGQAAGLDAHPGARHHRDGGQSKLLDNGVGYVRLKNFQGNTTRDMQGAIRAS